MSDGGGGRHVELTPAHGIRSENGWIITDPGPDYCPECADERALEAEFELEGEPS